MRPPVHALKQHNVDAGDQLVDRFDDGDTELVAQLRSEASEPVTAGREEIERNSRSRSAKLRAGEKLGLRD